MEEYIERIMGLEEIPLPLRQNVCEEMYHGMEVSNLAGMIAQEMRKSEQFCTDIEVAGILHDIGKLKLTKYLYAEDGLVVEQMKYVRQHTNQSYEIIMSAGYSTEIGKAVYHHHENCDGSGYPDNLRKEDIPIMARVLRVCDVFIALTTNRPYRKAFDPKSALEIMIDEVMNYDMEVFLAFQRVIHREVFPIGMDKMKYPRHERQKEPLELFEKELMLLA